MLGEEQGQLLLVGNVVSMRPRGDLTIQCTPVIDSADTMSVRQKNL
jgi:hypothetical protein